jgi:hypothetical protein
MSVVLLVINMVLAFTLAYQSGKMKAMIDIDKIDGKETDVKIKVLWIADALISAYLIVSIYGAGVTNG